MGKKSAKPLEERDMLEKTTTDVGRYLPSRRPTSSRARCSGLVHSNLSCVWGMNLDAGPTDNLVRTVGRARAPGKVHGSKRGKREMVDEPEGQKRFLEST